jgi:hypothetical protein
MEEFKNRRYPQADDALVMRYLDDIGEKIAASRIEFSKEVRRQLDAGVPFRGRVKSVLASDSEEIPASARGFVKLIEVEKRGEERISARCLVFEMLLWDSLVSLLTPTDSAG